MRKPLRHHRLMAVMLLLIVSRSCGASTDEPAPPILGRWERVEWAFVGGPLDWLAKEYIEFRENGLLVSLDYSPCLKCSNEFWTLDTGEYSFPEAGRMQLRGKCWQGWQYYECSQVYGFNLNGDTLIIFEVGAKELQIEYRRVGALNSELPPTLSGPAATLTPAFQPTDVTLSPQPGVARPATVVQPTVTPPVPESTLTPPTAPLIYTVQPGETLFRIALKYGVTVEALRLANDLMGDTIYAGQMLIIPAPSTPPAALPTSVPPTLIPNQPTASPTTQPSATPARQGIALRWDTSPTARIIRYYTGPGELAYNPTFYVPEAQVWGDGRIIWTQDGMALTARQVLIGHLAPDQMKALLQRIVEAGFFGWQDRYGIGGSTHSPRHLAVSRIGQAKEVVAYDLTAPSALFELTDYLHGGTGVAGSDFLPTRGYLTSQCWSPVAGITPSAQWPEATAGFTLDQVGNGRYIDSETLSFAWHLTFARQQAVSKRRQTVVGRQKSHSGGCLMTTRLITLPQRCETQYAPLAVLGYCLTRTDFLTPLASVELAIKTVEHEPVQKLQDVLVSILANCSSVKQVDLRIRPDLVLAEAWGREQFAQQSTLAYAGCLQHPVGQTTARGNADNLSATRACLAS